MRIRKSRQNYVHLPEAFNDTKYLINGSSFLERFRKRPQDFTRRRKMPFNYLVVMILNQVKRSTQCALESFFAKLDQSEVSMRQQSFSDARQKIKWEGFRELYTSIVNLIYNDKHIWNTWHGYAVMAVDGSKHQLPSDPQLLIDFGGLGPSATTPTAQVSYLYDVFNDVLVDVRIAPLSTDERTLAKQHLEKLAELPGIKKKLLIFDRGYPSADLIDAVLAAGCDFLFRVRTKFNVNMDILPLGVHAFTLHGEKGEPMETKVIKLTLESGEIETLVTSIRDKRMGVEAFKALYFTRWGVETKIGELKHCIETENFSGRTKETIYQDFFASAYLSNIIAIASNEAQPIIDFATSEHVNKYTYKANKNHAVGVFKDHFIEAVLEEKPRVRKRRIERILLLVAYAKTPIRPNRSTPRNPTPRKANYHHNRKSNA